MSHAFIALAATQMIINSNRQAELDRMYANQLAQQNMIAQQNAYDAQQNAYVPPAPIQPAPESSGHGFFFYFFIALFIVALVIILIKFA